MTTVTTKDDAEISCKEWGPKSSDNRENHIPFFGDVS